MPITITGGGAIALSAGGAVTSSSIGTSSGVIGRNIITPASTGVILDTAAGLQDINRVYNGTGVGAIAVTSATAGTNLDLSNSVTGLNLPSMALAAGPGAVTYTGSFTPGSSVYRLGGITGGTLTFNQNITDAATTNRSSVAIQGAGTVILGGTNTFSGGFTLASGGTLQIASGNIAANFGANPAGLTSNGGTIQWGTGSTVDISPGGTGAISGGLTLAATTTFDTGANNVTLAGSIGNNGVGGLTKTGSGTLTLGGANTFTGTTTVSAGTLILNNTDALYKSNLASITNTGGAPNVQFSSSVASKVFTLGGLTGSVNMALQDNAGSPAAITLRIGNNNAASAYTGVLSGAGSIVKLGSGALTFSANQTYTGSTTITQGTNTSAGNGASSIALTFGASGGTLTNILPAATALKFGGTAPPQASPSAADIIAAAPGSGTLTFTGAAAVSNAQTVASTAIGLGGAGIVMTTNASAGATLLNLGAITRTGGGTLAITQPTNALSATNGVTTTSGSAGTILTDANGTAYATIGNNDWAAKDTVLSASNIITSAATAGAAGATLYTASIAATTAPGTSANVDFQVTNTTAWTSQTVNSLRLNAATAQTLSLAASNTLTVATGGILIGTGAAAAQTISGGTIISGTGKELVVINNGGATNVLTSVIADSTSGASDLTIRSNPNLGAGKGDIRLGSQNTYTGNTYITGGRVVQSNGTGTTPFGTGNVYIFGNTNGQFYQNQSNTITNHFYIEGNGWVETNGPFGAIRIDSGTISGAITLMGDAGIGSAGTGTGTISGAIDGAYTLTKTLGTNLIKLSGNNTSFTGATNITAGAFQYENANAIGGTSGITIGAASSAIGNYAGGGTALLSKVLTGSTGTVALTSASANDTMDFSATNAAGVYLGAAATITYGGTYTPNTVNGVATYRLGGGGGILTFGGNITGNSALVIGGGNGNNATGTVILSGTNTYRGGTTFASGTGSVTLQTPNSATPFAVLGTGPLVFTGNGIIQLNSSTAVANADLSSASNLTSISLNGGTAQFDTNNLGTLATPIVFAKSIGNYGAGVFQKNGAGFLRLDSVNTNLGNTQNTAGTLLINNANPFNAGFSVTGAASTAAQGPTGNSANTMQLLVNTTIATLVGTNSTSTSATAGILNVNSKNLTLAGATGATYTGTITNSTGTTLTKAGGATQTLGSNTGFAGTTNVAGGVLSLDYSVLTTTPTAIIAATSPLILSGGTLSMKNKGSGGTNAQTFAGLTINAGGSAFAANLNSGTSLTLNLGGITRTVAGGTVDFATGATSLGTGAVNTTATNGATTILGGYATAGGGASFATVSAGVISALATGSYSTTYSAGTDVDNGTQTTIGGSALSINSLRFNSATAQTVDATAGLTIASGGLLVTPTVAANATAITGGTITSGNGLDLIVNQFNTNAAGALTIGSQITGNIGLTKAGSGTLILTNAANNYTGATNIGGSGNAITTAYLQVNATGAIPSASQINLNSAGGLAILGGVSLSNNITISNASGTSGQGAIYAVGGSGTATVSGTVQVNNSIVAGGVFGAAAGTTLAVTGQVNAASGQIVSSRTGNVIFSGGGTYDYFEASGSVSLGATNGLSTGAVVNISGAATGGVLDLAGFSQTVAGLTKLTAANTATLTNSSATAATLTLNVGSAITTGAYTGNYTYSGALTGNLAVVKSGAGTETLSGANTFMGGTTLSAGTLKIGSGTALGGINGTSGALVINGGTLDLNGTSTVAVGAFSGSGGTITDTTAGTGTTVFSVASNSSASFAGAINDGLSKSLAFFKDGTGTLTLTNSSTYSGITNIFQGALNIQNATALGSTAGSTVVSTGAALEIQGGITVSAEALTLNGTGSGIATGALRNISGTNSFGGVVTLASASRINSDAGTLTLSNNVSSANFLPTFGGAGNTTVTGSMSLGTAGITKDGVGTLSLQNGNTFSGTTTVSNGTLNIRNAAALGTADGTAGSGTIVASGAVLQVQGGIAVGNEALITPILQSVSGNNSWAGNIQAADGGSLTLQSDANTLTLGGIINGQSPNATNRDVILTGAGDGALSNGITNPASVTKSGAGTWTLNGANTYSSATTISAGTLKAGAANVLSANSAYSLANSANAVLDLNNTAQTIAFLSGGGATGGNVSTGGASGILTTGDSTNTTFGGTISGAGGLVKQGSGTFSLSNSNGYTGSTTVSAGKLQVATGGAITASSSIAVNGGSLSVNGSISSVVQIAVASGAKILGTGTASGAITLNNGGIIEAGEFGVGQLTTGKITFGTNATDLAIVNLFNIGSSGSASIINAATLATLGGSSTITINATNSGSLSNGTYDLITHTGGALSTTDFAAFTKGVITGLSGRQSGTLTNGVNALQLFVAGDAPKWTGFDTTAGANSSSWQINPAITNWQLITATTPTDFQANDSALFDDNATGSLTVDINLADVAPTSVTFENSTKVYTLQSTGGFGITGSTGIVKNGTALVSINNSNSFTGGIIVNAGTLALNAANTFTGGVAINYAGIAGIDKGAVKLGAAGALGTTNTVSFGTAGTGRLQLNGYNATIVGLTTDSVTPGSVIVENSNTTLGADSTLTVNLASGTNTYAGVLQDGGAGKLGLTKAGNGTLILTGTNTLTGGNAVTGGTLQIGNGGASGVLTGDTAISASTSLVFNRDNSSTSTYAGGISGAGSLTAQGGGTTILTGNAAHTGGTSIASGSTLQIGIGGGTGALSGTGTITNNGTLAYNRDNTASSTIQAIIASTGALAVNSGTLILTGANTFSGSNTIASGATLQIGAGGTAGTLGSAVSVTDNGALVFNRSDAISIGTNVTGTGALTMAGAGSLTLTGTNSYSGGTNIQSGSLVLGSTSAIPTNTAVTVGSSGNSGTLDLNGRGLSVSSLSTAGTAVNQTITNNSTTTAILTYNSAGSSTFGGSITDGAPTKKIGVTITGGGTLLLNKTNAYTRGTIVTSGTAKLGANNAFSTGALTLGGTGTVGTLDLNGFNQSISSLAVGSGAVAASQIIGNSSTTANSVLNYTGNATTFASTIQDVIGGGTQTTGLTLSGTGIFSVTANNTYTGTTTIGAGTTLQFGTDGTVGNIGTGPVTDNGGLSFNRSNSYTLAAGNLVTGSGTVTLANSGKVASAVNGQFNTTGTLFFGSSNASTIASDLDLTAGSSTFGGLSVQTNTAAANTIELGANTLTINGNVNVGNTTAVNGQQTNLTVTGATGTLAVNLGAAGTFRTGTFTGGTNIVGLSAVDLSGLANFTVTGGATSAFSVAQQGDNNAIGVVSMRLANTANSIQAATLTVGNGSSSPVQSLRLGNGTGATNVFNVDTLNIGTGARDSGLFSFDTGTGSANGTVSISNRLNSGGTVFNMGTNGNNTAAILANVFDVTGHTANLNFAAAAVGNVGGRGGNGTNTFSFDKGSLTFLNISASTRTTTGTMASTFNFGSASSTLSDTVNVTNGILQLGLASTVSGAIANGTVNIAGGTVNIGATSGTSITMAAASISGASSTALVNLTGGTTTLSGDMVKTGGAGTTSATVTLNGASAVLDMSNKKIGSAAQTIVFNAQAGTLKNLAELNGGGTLTKTTGGTLILEGANSYTGPTVISAGTLQVGSGSTTGTLGTNTGAIDNSGTLAINRSNTFALANAVNGSGGLSQIGSGTTTLTGVNNYTGATTVSAGTLQVGVAGVGSTSATSAVTVNGSGAALAGTGTVNGNVTVTLGTIRPGDSAGTGVGTLNIGGALVVGTSAATTGTLSHGLIAAGYTDSAFNAAYDGTFNALTYLDNAKTAATSLDPDVAAQAAALINSWKYTPTTSQNDYIKVTGTLTLNTLSILELTDASSGGALVSSLQIGSVFNLMDWSGVRTGSAGSSTLSMPSTLSDALTAVNLSFDTSAFSTYGVVVVVPEPSRTLLFFFGLAAFIARRRKR